MQRERVRPADGPQHPIDRPHPGHDGSIVEADGQLHVHGDLSRDTLDNADEIGIAAARGHAVDEPHGSAIGLELRLEHERVAAIPPGHPADPSGRRDQPAAVIGAAEERRKTRGRIETRQTQPVD
jgi:hypothetical protein